MNRSTLPRTLIVLAALLATSAAYAQNTVDLALSTTISADKSQLTPKLTVTTTPVATQCTASGDAAWVTAWAAKAPNGTVTLPAFPSTDSHGYALQCDWPGDTQAVLAWVPPTTNTDGSALAKCPTATTQENCLAGYLIEFGTSPTNLSSSRFHMFPQSTGTPVTGLTAGQSYTFAVRAMTGLGGQSARSNTVGKALAANITVTQQAGIKTPNAPTLQ